MSKALVKRGGGSASSGIVPAVASAIVPGVGQLINGETDKAIGVFVVAAVAGWSAVAWLPLSARSPPRPGSTASPTAI